VEVLGVGLKRREVEKKMETDEDEAVRRVKERERKASGVVVTLAMK
jgi:hypothetical protein